MYPDSILFMIAFILGALALVLVLFLIVSRKKGKLYSTILKQETTAYETFVKTTFSGLTEDYARTEVTQDDVLTVLDEDGGTAFSFFDNGVLDGKYELKREIHGGGMSRVFVAQNLKLGNYWIIKFIPTRFQNSVDLSNEVDILRELNHINLPSVVDVFSDEKGVYIVESYIEGLGLNKIMEERGPINQALVFDWALQLAQVLGYLHHRSPSPIYHFDLKPSNLILTHDNKLVLIDFGISRKAEQAESKSRAVTYRYAAPEQLGGSIPEKYKNMIEARFGTLPGERHNWAMDARTDIYSLGVILFELLTGQNPGKENIKLLDNVASPEFRNFIKKCIQLEPRKRYQTADEMIDELQSMKNQRLKMAKSVFMRKTATIAATLCMVGAMAGYASGYQIYTAEEAAKLGILPDLVKVSLQQSQTFNVEKQMQGGDVHMMDGYDLKWTDTEKNIAQLDGNKVHGINLGSTIFNGTYRNKSVSLGVKVVEPMDGLVDISQRYYSGHKARTFIQSESREFVDGSLKEASLVSPESMASLGEDIYFTDAGKLRLMKRENGEYRIVSLALPEKFMSARLVRTGGGEVFVLTEEWEAKDGYYTALLSKTAGTSEFKPLYEFNTLGSRIVDFVYYEDALYVIEDSPVAGKTLLKKYYVNQQEAEILSELNEGAHAITVSDQGDFYIANSEKGIIELYSGGECKFFAGLETERAFVDGKAPLFYTPFKIRFHEGHIYVFDFNVLRRIELQDGSVKEVISVAGEASPEFSPIEKTEYAAEDIIFPNSLLSDFVLIGDKVYISDPKRGAVWEIE